jgi:N6-adenosine-specific RNA methylase IME4
MKDIPLNSILPNGSRVCAVMQISNLDKNGEIVEKMYKVKRNDEEDIVVSGSHLIYDAAVDNFIHVKDLPVAEVTDINCPVLYCLITSDHTIQIGDWIFHDWEDSNGSEPKNISN